MNGRTHILIVDNDPHSRALLNDCLQSHGYRVTAVNDGAAMHRVIERRCVDLVLLDVQLAGEDGLALCRDVCRHTRIPVVICSKLADDIDRIVGLEVGADDYIAKPFEPRELLVRAKAILRRTFAAAVDTSCVRAYAFDRWQLEVVERALRHASGVRVAVSDAELRLLIELLDAAPRPVLRSRLTERLRAREFDPSDRSIDVRVSRLRRMLAIEGRSPEIIRTVYGQGYAIAVDVRRVNGAMVVKRFP